MKFRAAPLTYRAVCDGLYVGMQAAQKLGPAASPEQVLATTASAIMTKLHEIIIFDQEEENLLTLQSMATEMANQKTDPATPPTE